MNEQKIEELKNALREVVQLLAARGKPLSEDIKIILVQVMEHVADRIQQLRQEEIPETPQEPIKLARTMPSSNIHSFGYDKDNQRLLVKFQGDYPNQDGPVYQYEGVPETIFQLFKNGSVPARTDGRNKWGEWWKGKVPSLGASMYALIKNGGYPYQRMT